MTDDIVYPVGKNLKYLKNKNYSMFALSYALLNGRVGQESDSIVVFEEGVIAAWKRNLNLSDYKCSVIINAFLDAGVAVRSEGNLVFTVEEDRESSLILNIPIVKYCLEHLTEFEFRVYCALAYKYNTSKAYNNEMYYCLFSNKELLESIGYYAADSGNLKRVNETLALLETLELINYSEKFTTNSEGISTAKQEGVVGKQGLYTSCEAASTAEQYRRLYWVNQKFSPATKDSNSEGVATAKQYSNTDCNGYEAVTPETSAPIKKYTKTDMLIASLVNYLYGLRDYRTNEWLDEVLDFYSRE